MYDKRFVEQLEEFIPHLHEVKFFGGEPFVIDLYYQIWEKIVQIKPEVLITIQTNGTVLNDRIKRIMEHGNFHITVSLDSLNPEVYQRIRQNSDLDKVKSNIQYFRNYAKSKENFIGISVCAMRHNWKDFPHLVEYCHELDIPIYFHTLIAPLDCSLWNLSEEQLMKIIKYLTNHKFEQNTPCLLYTSPSPRD